MSGVYAVLVPPDISEDPVRWLFENEVDADAFAEALGDYAWVSFEPIAESLEDADLAYAFPETVAEARRALEEDT